jgi:hypothetical protein
VKCDLLLPSLRCFCNSGSIHARWLEEVLRAAERRQTFQLTDRIKQWLHMYGEAHSTSEGVRERVLILLDIMYLLDVTNLLQSFAKFVLHALRQEIAILNGGIDSILD